MLFLCMECALFHSFVIVYWKDVFAELRICALCFGDIATSGYGFMLYGGLPKTQGQRMTHTGLISESWTLASSTVVPAESPQKGNAKFCSRPVQ